MRTCYDFASFLGSKKILELKFMDFGQTEWSLGSV